MREVLPCRGRSVLWRCVSRVCAAEAWACEGEVGHGARWRRLSRCSRDDTYRAWGPATSLRCCDERCVRPSCRGCALGTDLWACTKEGGVVGGVADACPVNCCQRCGRPLADMRGYTATSGERTATLKGWMVTVASGKVGCLSGWRWGQVGRVVRTRSVRGSSRAFRCMYTNRNNIFRCEVSSSFYNARSFVCPRREAHARCEGRGTASRTDCYCGVCRGGVCKVFHTCVRDAAMTAVLATLAAATGGHVGQGEYAAAHDERPARAIVISTLHIQGL